MMTAINVNMLIATGGPSLAIPGPYWLFTGLHWLTFTLHLIAMNILFGGLLIFLLAGKSALRKLLFETQTRLFPTAMAATITLGVAPLLFTQLIYGRFFYSASIVSGWNWFLQMVVLIIVYYLLYAVAIKEEMSVKNKLTLLTLAAIGFVYISFTFTMISDLAEKPFLWGELYRSSPAGFSLNPDFHETIFRWGHIIAGGVAVAGIVVALFALYFPKVAGNRDLLRFGGRVYLLGVIKAAVLAIIYLLVLDTAVFRRFLISPGLHAILAAIVLNIIAALLVYKSSNASRPKPLILATAVMVFFGVFCMVLGRHFLRLTYLAEQFDPAAIDTGGGMSPFILFLVTFIIGLVILFWMLRKFFTARASAR